MGNSPKPSEDLLRQFEDGLRRFVSNRIPTAADAADVLQEVRLRIHQGASRIEHEERVASWVYTVARRTIADFYRERYRRQEGVLAGVPIDEAPEPETLPLEGTHDVHEEVLSWLRPLMDELPEPYRTALLRTDVEGATQQEFADAFGLSLSGAKSRVQRARKMLGELLKVCCEIEFGPDGRAVEYRSRARECRLDC